MEERICFGEDVKKLAALFYDTFDGKNAVESFAFLLTISIEFAHAASEGDIVEYKKLCDAFHTGMMRNFSEADKIIRDKQEKDNVI